ncbi:hypothetical protein [Xanthobacter tagetidis]|uniref:Uncharacterized protein n=1 Tax=Xanthobacter tagetidis TaxID=60216 RepID=A0A3L7AGJ7_9HYPH|nr:hypothetical protein [Xanthobacter tagetidis]MBB6306227.1 hypothetical protein [Xanthobacter tagetidis]RLP79509.1 hypothetical protein D9R14_07540 [Xanthobacter tagetidis]
MSDILPTVRVVNPAAPGEYKIINEADLKPHHVLWSEGAGAPPAAAGNDAPAEPAGQDQKGDPADKPADGAPADPAAAEKAPHDAPPSPPAPPAAPRDPLDHDGDGRKGGSAPLATAGKGPGGRWYVKRAKEIVSGPYPDETAAQAAAEKENAS